MSLNAQSPQVSSALPSAARHVSSFSSFQWMVKELSERVGHSVRSWVYHWVCDAWQATEHWPSVSNYTAWWQRHICVNNLLRAATWKRNGQKWVQCLNHYSTMPTFYWTLKLIFLVTVDWLISETSLYLFLYSVPVTVTDCHRALALILGIVMMIIIKILLLSSLSIVNRYYRHYLIIIYWTSGPKNY